jgi:hypothetical protein
MSGDESAFDNVLKLYKEVRRAARKRALGSRRPAASLLAEVLTLLRSFDSRP